MWLKIEGLSGNSGVIIRDFLYSKVYNKGCHTDKETEHFNLRKYLIKKKVSSAETKMERNKFFLKKEKMESVCLSGAVRLTALCCVLHPNYDVQLDSDVNIMAFICVVYASIQRYCSRILTYL